jgi:hypothetical protein
VDEAVLEETDNEDHDGSADNIDDLSNLPDADADPTEVVDAGAEDSEGNEEIASGATHVWFTVQ